MKKIENGSRAAKGVPGRLGCWAGQLGESSQRNRPLGHENSPLWVQKLRVQQGMARGWVHPFQMTQNSRPYGFLELLGDLAEDADEARRGVD
jgi:hypothetical protein